MIVTVNMVFLFFQVLALIVACLSVAGIANTKDPQRNRLFIGVLVLVLIGLFATLGYKLLKSHSKSSYQVDHIFLNRTFPHLIVF